MAGPVDWSLHFHVGDEPDQGRQWEDAVRFGFLSGGWAPVPQRAFRQMTVGDQVWVRLTWKGGARPGYVARATVVRPPAPVQDAVIVVDGVDVPFVRARERMRGFYPASREEQDAAAPHEAGMRRQWSRSETDEWVVAVRWDGALPVDQRLTHDQVPSPGLQTGYRTRPEHIRLLEQAIPRNLAPEQRLDWQDDDFTVTVSPNADVVEPGSREQERKEEAERLAVWLTALHYDRLGWTVRSVEHEDGLGYDLLATKGTARRHLEVKGTTGVLAAPHLERSQKECAETDPDWRLVVVTRALDAPEAIELTGPEVLDCGLEAVRWRVQCNGSGRLLVQRHSVPVQATRTAGVEASS